MKIDDNLKSLTSKLFTCEQLEELGFIINQVENNFFLDDNQRKHLSEDGWCDLLDEPPKEQINRDIDFTSLCLFIYFYVYCILKNIQKNEDEIKSISH